MKNPTRTIFIAIATATAITATTAFASTSQQDVQTCRVAMQDQAGVDLTNYRLRFLNAKGNNQGRTLTLKAISHKGAPSFRFTCTLNKNIVVALNNDRVVRFAKR